MYRVRATLAFEIIELIFLLGAAAFSVPMLYRNVYVSYYIPVAVIIDVELFLWVIDLGVRRFPRHCDCCCPPASTPYPQQSVVYYNPAMQQMPVIQTAPQRSAWMPPTTVPAPGGINAPPPM